MKGTSRNLRAAKAIFRNAINLRPCLAAVNCDRNGAIHQNGGHATCAVKNCIGVFGLSPQHLDCFDSGKDKQFDFLSFGFALHFLQHGQSALGTTADDELAASPGDFFVYRERSVAELLAKFLGRFVLGLRISPRSMMTSCSYVLPSIWMEPKENFSKRIRQLLAQLTSGAFLRRDSVEGRPALLDFLAGTVRTDYVSLFVIDEGQDFGEVFLTIVAEEIVVGQTTSSEKVAEVILELATAEHNLVWTVSGQFQK